MTETHNRNNLISFNPLGLYCEKGGFYVDPWGRVNKAIITHAHSDHARQGSNNYICSNGTLPMLKFRLGNQISVSSYAYAEPFFINGVKVTFYPAGHIVGSSQIKIEYKGEVWVISGDYKTKPDGLCEAFEPIKCHSFISECTFGLPVFNWEGDESIKLKINAWWEENAKLNKPSVIGGYALGKAQKILHLLDDSIGEIYTHGAVENCNEVLRAQGVKLKKTTRISGKIESNKIKSALIIAPPSSLQTNWINNFKDASISMASGWMMLRGARRRRNLEKGFVLSDHADWNGLLEAIKQTDAENIYVTHGYTEIFSKYLKEIGYNCQIVKTEFGEDDVDSNLLE